MHQQHLRWFYLWMAAVILLLPQPLWADTNEYGCVTRHVKQSFLQLWRSDSGRSDMEWDRRFRRLAQLGFQEVIVQWSMYGNVSFFKHPSKDVESSPSLAAMIRAAARQNIRIKLGLHYDPEFWNHIDGDKKVETYLNNRLRMITESLAPLLTVVEGADPNGTVVNGWYISDEIDDLNWKDNRRRIALTNYLQTLRQLLAQKKGHWPVSISGYATGQMPPKHWAQMWKGLLGQTEIDTFLFQDGIGTGQMAMAKLPLYLSELSTALDNPASRLGVIVEIFDINPSSEAFQTQSAAFRRIAEQLRVADAHTRRNIAVFSATDHLIGQPSRRQQELHRHWMNDRKMCRRNAGTRSLGGSK